MGESNTELMGTFESSSLSTQSTTANNINFLGTQGKPRPETILAHFPKQMVGNHVITQ